MNISGVELTSAQAYSVYQHVLMAKYRDEAEHHLAFAIDDLVQKKVIPNDWKVTDKDIDELVDDYIRLQNKNVAENETWRQVSNRWKDKIRTWAALQCGLISDDSF